MGASVNGFSERLVQVMNGFYYMYVQSMMAMR